MKQLNVRNLGTWLLIVACALLVLLIGVTVIDVAVFVARDFSLKQRAQLTIDAATRTTNDCGAGIPLQPTKNELTR